MSTVQKAAATLTFPIKSYSPITMPDKTHSRGIAIVNVRDIPDLTGHRRVNVRDARSTGAVPRAIRQSLIADDGRFVYKNEGLVIAAESFKVNDHTLSATLSNSAIHGLLNGGHTYATIKDVLSGDDAPEKQFVQIEFLGGFDDTTEIAEIIEARNTSTQVKIQSLMNFAGNFDPLKKALANEPYAANVAYKEFELGADGSGKKIDIREVVAALTCFDIASFPGTAESEHPIVAYRSKTGTLAHLEAHNREMRPLMAHLPTMLRLYDTIQAEFVARHTGTLKSLPGVVKFTRDRRPNAKFTGQVLTHRVPLGYVLPVLAAFRALLTVKGAEATWSREPLAAWRGPLGAALVATIAARIREFKSANAVGKANGTWHSCFVVAKDARKSDATLEALKEAA